MRTLPLVGVALACAVLGLGACADGTTAPATDTLHASRVRAPVSDTLIALVRSLTAGRGITALPDPPYVRPALVRLGHALVFDKILSGNRDIACMTCHLPHYATTDGRSLAIGQGGTGLGPSRTHPQDKYVPRNAPSLFNLYALGPLFLDGRVERDSAGHYHTPAGAQLTPAMTRVFEFGTASAIPLFPPLVRVEMRGDSGNELAALPDDSARAIWADIMTRLGKIPEYRSMFEAAYPGTKFDDMNFAYASNAIGGFLIAKLSFDNTPWDRFLRGDNGALTEAQLVGAKTFMSLKCSVCHNGTDFTDNQFHNVAVAQIGPGEGDGLGGHDDFGRMRVTGNPADKYLFRTSPLRNITLTAPYGHDGAIVSLRDFVAHYSESGLKLENYDPSQLDPDLQGTVQHNASDILATRDTSIATVVFDDQITDELTTFLGALTDSAAARLDYLVPTHVPSGLPVDGAPDSVGSSQIARAGGQ